MVNEVESILHEIRERVRADEEQHPAALAVTRTRAGDGAEDRVISSEEKSNFEESAALARLSAHLTTTGRAWDSLPPVFSNRSGAVARLELWIKARFKTLGRWFTWEQVNFNAAVHYALTDALEALGAQQQQLITHEQQLITMRGQASAEAESWRARFEKTEREIQALRVGLEAQAAELRRQGTVQADNQATNLELQSANEVRARETSVRLADMATETGARLSGLAKEMSARLSDELRRQAANHAANLELQSANEARARETSARLADMATETGARLSGLAKEMTARLSELTSELREYEERLREEQRVCFKQLSLETSEAAVLEDRGRRAIESRLERLEKAQSADEK